MPTLKQSVLFILMALFLAAAAYVLAGDRHGGLVSREGMEATELNPDGSIARNPDGSIKTRPVDPVLLPSVDVSRQRLLHLSPLGYKPKEPELVLLTNLLGGFRGLLVDAVWLRAGKLQQQEKFWELYQLYDWIGKLQPHLEEIWVFNGWNMSYNLVAEHPDSEARWQWIQRAIRWLRDEGLRYNPRSGKIMKEISWIYFHKIGRNLDLHHYYYKNRLAHEMHRVLGSRDMQDVKGIRAAPDSLADLLKDADVARALSGFTLEPPQPEIAALGEVPGLHRIAPQVMQYLLDPKNRRAWDKVRCYVARRVLRNEYKFGDETDAFGQKYDTTQIMVEMEEAYGKFDWRLPEPHAIYWAWRALRTSDRAPKLQDQINYDRMVMFSLQEVMRRGVITYLDPDPSVPMITSFDLSKVAPIDRLYKEMMSKYDWDRQDYGAESVRDGHVQFLQEVSFDLYFAGYETEANKYYRELKALYDKPSPWMPLANYCLGRVKKLVDEFGTEAKVMAFIDGCINRACFYLCMNKPDEARKWENLAQEAYVAYKVYDEANAQGRIRHVGLHDWRKYLRGKVMAILAGHDRSFPPDLIPVLRRIVGVKEGEELDKLDFDRPLAPKIPESSPPPK